MIKNVNKILFFLLGIILFIPLIGGGRFLNPAPFSQALIFNILIELAFIFYLILLAKDKKYQPYFTPIHLLSIIFIFFLLLSTALSVDPQMSFWGGLNRGDGIFFILHIWLYFFILTWAVKSQKEWFLFLRIAVLVGFLAGLITVISQLFIKFPSLIAPFAISGIGLPFGNPNFLAHFVLILIFPCFYFFIISLKTKNHSQIINQLPTAQNYATCSFKQKIFDYSQNRWSFLKTKAKYFYLITLILLAISIFLSRSLTAKGLLILLTGLFILILFIYNWRKYLSYFIVYPASLMIFFIVKNVNNVLIAEGGSLIPRLYAWKVILSAAKFRLLTGYGWFNLKFVYDKFYDPWLNFYPALSFDKAHNDFLEYLIAGGIFCFLIFCIFWGYILSKLVKRIAFFLKNHNHKLTKQIFLSENSLSFQIYLMFFFIFLANLLFVLFNFAVPAVYIYLNLFLGLLVIILPSKKISLKIPRIVLRALTPLFLILISLSILKLNIKPLWQNYQLNTLNSYLNFYSLAFKNDYQEVQKAADKMLNENFYYFDHQKVLVQIYNDINQKHKISQEAKLNVYQKIKFLNLKILKERPYLSWQYIALAYNEQNFGPDFNPNYLIEAENYFKQAVSLSPNQGFYQFELAKFYFLNNRLDEAYKIFKQLSQTNYPKEADFYLGLAEILKGNLPSGQKTILNSLIAKTYSTSRWVRTPFTINSSALPELEKIYKTSGQTDKITSLYKTMLALQPKNYALHLSLIKYYTAQGKLKEAKKQTWIAIREFPEKEFLLKIILSNIR